MKGLFKKRKWKVDWYIDENNKGYMESENGNFFEFVIALLFCCKK